MWGKGGRARLVASREGGCPGDPTGPLQWCLALRLIWGLAEHPGGALGPLSLGSTPCSCLEVEEQKEGGYGLTLGFGVSRTLQSERRNLCAHFPPSQPLGRGCSVGPIQGRSPEIGEVHARATHIAFLEDLGSLSWCLSPSPRPWAASSSHPACLQEF